MELVTVHIHVAGKSNLLALVLPHVVKDATDPQCGFQVNAIWLSYPQGSKAKSGPLAIVTAQPAHYSTGTYKVPARTPVTLDKSKEFKQFDALLAQSIDKIGGMCMGCARYEVTATLVGRLDTVADATLKRDAGKIVGFGGFGNMNAYPARLVLQSVSNVTSKEIDYSKAEAITKGAMAPVFALRQRQHRRGRPARHSAKNILARPGGRVTRPGRESP